MRISDVCKDSVIAEYGELVLPSIGYAYEDGMVWFFEKTDTKKVLFQSLIFISAIYVNSITSEHFLQITCLKNGKLQNIVEPQTSIASASAILSLAKRGLMVSSKNASALSSYLNAFLVVNDGILAEKELPNSIGWTNNGEFLFGRRLVTATGKIDENAGRLFVSNNESIVQVMKSVDVQGNLKGWYSAIQPIVDYPIVEFSLYLSFAAPLLEYFGVQSFVTELVSTTSSGKTSLQQIAASVWGNPVVNSANSFLKTGNATVTAMEEIAADLSGLPFIINDLFKDNANFQSEGLVYTIANGQARIRANRKGEVADIRNIQTIILSSSERTIEEAYNSNKQRTDPFPEGVRARTLSIADLPWGKVDTIHVAPIVENTVRGVNKNYGVAGLEFIAKFIKYKKKRAKTWKNIYDNYIQYYRKEIDKSDNINYRKAPYFALIMTTGVIVHELLKMPFEFSQVKFDVLWQSIKSHSISNNIKNIDYLQSIADFIKDKVSSGEIWDSKSLSNAEYSRGKHIGLIKAKYIAIEPEVIEKRLGQNTRIFLKWCQDKKLLFFDTGLLRKSIKMPSGENRRLYAFNLAILDKDAISESLNIN